MSGVTYNLQLESREMQTALGRLSPAMLGELAFEIGSLVEDQTRRRIADEKTAPDGSRWSPWSMAYDANRNHAKHSLLVGEGHLQGSVQNYTTGLEAVVGSNLIYAAVHQFGGDTSARAEGVPDGAVGAGIPARPYLGLSIENATEIEELVVLRIEELLQ